MKVFYKALAACKVAWREREALKEALFERKGKAQRLTLAALVVMLLMVVVARVTDQSRPPERIDLAALAIVEAQQESEVQKALQIAQEQERYRAEAEAVAKVLYGTVDKQTGLWHGLERSKLSDLMANHTKSILGDGVRTHALRHGFASSALSLGVSLDQISEILGHSGTQTTKIYAQRLNPAETACGIGDLLSRAYC